MAGDEDVDIFVVVGSVLFGNSEDGGDDKMSASGRTYELRYEKCRKTRAKGMVTQEDNSSISLLTDFLSEKDVVDVRLLPAANDAYVRHWSTLAVLAPLSNRT
jgi:hypothetical protein